MKSRRTQVDRFRGFVGLAIVVAFVLVLGAQRGVAHGAESGHVGVLPQYEAVPVVGPSPFIYTWVMDMNDSGDAVGYASAAAPALDPARAFLWSDDGEDATDLGDFGQGWPYAIAEAINDDGVVVGWAQIGFATYRGFIWSEGGPMMQLSNFARAIDIDSDGRVLGITLTSGGAIWQNGVYTNLPLLPGGGVFSPKAMNDHNQIVGSGISQTDGKQHAFLYDNWTYIDLGLAPDDDYGSEATAINNAGQVLGISRRWGTQNLPARMVIWEQSPDAGGYEIAHIIDPLPGDYDVIAMDINEAGDAVGMSGWPQTPVLWTGGELHNLNTLLAPGQTAVFFIATAINNNGWIGVDGQFGCCGYVLKPVVADECPGDLNGDRVVNVTDLLNLLSEWGECPGSDCPADLNGDEIVNVSDLLILLSVWGECP